MEWFPAGKKDGHEFRIGSINGEPGSSMSINLTTGRWADFAGDLKGSDPISLLAAVRGCKQGEAAKELAERLSLGNLTATAPKAAPAAPPAPAAEPRVPVAIRVEETPNPDARKFVCSRKLVEKGSLVFNDAASAAEVPFALAVFELGGIRTVFATRDFVTVTRMSDAPGWRELQPRIEAALRESLAR